MDKTLLDIFWVLVCAGFVFLMQGGFLCLEAGLTRSKNNINVALKNLAPRTLSSTSPSAERKMTADCSVAGFAFRRRQTS